VASADNEKRTIKMPKQVLAKAKTEFFLSLWSLSVSLSLFLSLCPKLEMKRCSGKWQTRTAIKTGKGFFESCGIIHLRISVSKKKVLATQQKNNLGQQPIWPTTNLANNKFRQQQISPTTNLANNKFRQQPIWPTTNLANNKFRQQPILPTTNFANNKFRQQPILSTTNFANNKFRQQQISPTTNFANDQFGQQQISPTTNLANNQFGQQQHARTKRQKMR